MINRPSLDEYYIDVARVVSQRATCLKKHYGAVIVNQNKGIVATGYNGAPCGEEHCIVCSKKSSGKDFSTFLECKSVHAEMNCIINASKEDMVGSTLYLAGFDASTGEEITAYPCEICLRLIKNAGIDKIVNNQGIIYSRNNTGILVKLY